MALTITIKGNGTVDKVVDENSTTLTAKPNDEWNFKHFKTDSDTITDNPYTIEVVADFEVIATFYMTVVSYIRGKVGFEITDSAIDAILLERGVDGNTDVSDLSFEEKELLYADALMWGATLPTVYSGTKESDGGWTHTEGSSTIQASDKKRFEAIAQEIYSKYNDPKKVKSKIKIVNLNGYYRR